MYASLPSGEDSTSWGSGPADTRPTILSVAGSTIASVLSLFSRTSRAGEGVCAAAESIEEKNKRLRHPRWETNRERKLLIGNSYLGGSGLASCCSTFGGSDLMRLIYAAAFHNLSSESHFPLANIPERRMPCLATKKICASV